MHEKIQDVMNTAWKNYKDYRRNGDMRQYTKQMSVLVEKYKDDPLLQFAENMASLKNGRTGVVLCADGL